MGEVLLLEGKRSFCGPRAGQTKRRITFQTPSLFHPFSPHLRLNLYPRLFLNLNYRTNQRGKACSFGSWRERSPPPTLDPQRFDSAHNRDYRLTTPFRPRTPAPRARFPFPGKPLRPHSRFPTRCLQGYRGYSKLRTHTTPRVVLCS